nr:amino acid racemase [uncultured Roseovarius sp.]
MNGPIGVIGGMGPDATVLFQQRLIAAVAAHDDADHIPLLIDMNPQIPSRITRLIDGYGADPEPVLIAMAKRLESMGTTALAMPCNTAHHYADAIAGSVSVPLLNMPRLAAERAAHFVTKGSAVGILASPATQRVGLFQKALAPQGLDALYPDCGDALLQTIKRIKAGQNDTQDAAVLYEAASEAVSRGAKCLFVGCSEFSLIKEAAEGMVPVIDTLDVLVDAVVEFADLTSASTQSHRDYL